MTDPEIQRIKRAITTEFDVTSEDIETLNENVETVIEELFADHDIEVTDDAVMRIQRQLLRDVLDSMRLEGERENATAGHGSDSKPEVHIERLQAEMRENGENAQQSVQILTGKLSTGLHGLHPITQFSNKQLEDKYSPDN